MARAVILSDLEARARSLANVENDPNITSTECTSLANRHLTEVYDALVDAGPPEYYAASTIVTTVAGTTLYALPADFRTLLEVYAQESSTDYRLIHPVRNGERGSFRAPTGAWAVTLEYIPAAPILVNPGDSFDGVSGWEELITNLMARDIMVKREASIMEVSNSIAMLQARIASRARNRDKGHAKYITDMDAQAASFPWCSTTNSRINGYRLRAGNIELYEPLWGASVSAAKITALGKVTILDAKTSPDEVVTSDDAADATKLARLLIRILATIATLRRSFQPARIDYEDIPVAASGGIVQLQHNFGGRVRWWVVGWQSAGTTAPILIESTLKTTTSTLVLASYVVGTATIRVEKAG